MIVYWTEQLVGFDATVTRNEVDLIFIEDGTGMRYDFRLNKENIKWLRKALKKAKYLMEMNKEES